MRHEAYQFEFPLHQGEFGFMAKPSFDSRRSLLWLFCWWAVLRIETFRFREFGFFDASLPIRK
jgi:hypothetical protein